MEKDREEIEELISDYQEMAQDDQQNAEAKEWEKIESTISKDSPW